MKLGKAGMIVVALVGAMLVLSCSGSKKTGSGSPTTIGALLPMTGALASYGETSNAALADAASNLSGSGGGKVTLVVEDTRTDPSVALEKLKSLHDKGVRLVIGPYSS